MYRKGVSAIIVNQKNEFLLVNLESFEEKYFAILGGGVDKSETLEVAVYREIQEELEVKKNSLTFVGKSEVPHKFKFKTTKLIRDGKEYSGSERHFFGFKFVGDDKIIIPKLGEVRTYKWVAYDDLKDYLLFDNQLEVTTEKILELFPFVKKNVV